jgi:hypothetical protein
MLVYHGSNLVVSSPDVSMGRKKLDFGTGFYTTTLAGQAKAWAKRKAYENDCDFGFVSVYEFCEDGDLNILCFEGYGYDWLMFVVDNRKSGTEVIWHGYDVIRGGIADDRVIDSINYFVDEITAGRLSDELTSLTLKQLSYQSPNDQICFATQKALDSLVFLESYEVTR